MRFLHTSDWHLGRTLHRMDLSHAFETWCDHVVEVTRSEDIDALIIAGDVYDRPVPPVAMVQLLQDTLERLCEHTQVIMISGNHDSAQRLGFGAPLMRDGLFIRTQSRDCGDPICLHGRDGTLTRVYTIPYLDPTIQRHELAPDPDRPLPRTHEAVVNAAVGRIEADIRSRSEQAVNVVVAHDADPSWLH